MDRRSFVRAAALAPVVALVPAAAAAAPKRPAKPTEQRQIDELRIFVRRINGMVVALSRDVREIKERLG